MEYYRRPVAEGRPADAYCVECDAPMTGDEAALNYKLTDRKTTHILCPACLGLVLEKTPESPLDCKEIQPVHSEGDQPWVFFGRNDAKLQYFGHLM